MNDLNQRLLDIGETLTQFGDWLSDTLDAGQPVEESVKDTFEELVNRWRRLRNAHANGEDITSDLAAYHVLAATNLLGLLADCTDQIIEAHQVLEDANIIPQHLPARIRAGLGKAARN